MRGVNFVYFFTVFGFFLGIAYATIKSTDPESFLIFTLAITSFFYLFGHISVGFYFRTLNAKLYSFPKDNHEKQLDTIVKEISRREKIIDIAHDLTISAASLNATKA